MSRCYEKTPAEQAEFDQLLAKLDNRHFTILPTGEKFRGSAQGAKHRALEILETLPVGSTVRTVTDEGTIFCQTSRPEGWTP